MSLSHTTEKSGNVFADLGFTEEVAANLKLRAEVMATIEQWIQDNSLKQREVAEKLGITQSRVSDLMRGKIDVFSLDTLITFASKLGFTTELHLGHAA